ncbi:unnamed protein product [Auanema sp. JU1783]|nr:unnamed protein product [Auanema sp. JU1783]
MGLSDTQVKTWYQNRRTKWKRQASVGIDLLNEAGNFAAVQQVLRSNPYWASYLSSAPGLAAAAATTPTRMPQPPPGAMAAFLPAGLASFPGAAGFPANLQFLSFMPTTASLNGQSCISAVTTPSTNTTSSASNLIAQTPSSPIKLDLDVSSDKSD